MNLRNLSSVSFCVLGSFSHVPSTMMADVPTALMQLAFTIVFLHILMKCLPGRRLSHELSEKDGIRLYQTIGCGYETYGGKHGGRVITLYENGGFETETVVIEQKYK